jgi:hypothetical protein
MKRETCSPIPPSVSRRATPRKRVADILRFALFLLVASEPVESAAQDVLTVPRLADPVVLAGIDDQRRLRSKMIASISND